ITLCVLCRRPIATAKTAKGENNPPSARARVVKQVDTRDLKVACLHACERFFYFFKNSTIIIIPHVNQGTLGRIVLLRCYNRSSGSDWQYLKSVFHYPAEKYSPSWWPQSRRFK